MKLAGMLSFYPVIRTTPVTRTKYIDFIAAIAVNVVVPAFAKNVSVWRGGVSTVALTLDFKDTAGNVLYTFLLAAGSSMTDPIPLSDDVASIDVTKTAGADNAFDVRLIFELSF